MIRGVSAPRERDSRDKRRNEAVRWFVILQNRTLKGWALRSWEKWKSAEENRQEFERVKRVWRAAGSARAWSIPGGSVNAEDDRRPEPRPPAHVVRAARPVFVRSCGLWAVALAVVVAILPGVATALHRHTAVSPSSTVAARIGPDEHKELLLEDGSRIELGPNTSVTYANGSRAVVLGRADALFSVAPDRTRPFRRSASGGTITAMGTTFHVRHGQSEDDVGAVTYGSVDVAPDTSPGGASAVPVWSRATPSRAPLHRLSQRQAVSYDLRWNASSAQPTDGGTTVAWRRGRYEYHRVPLSQVIQDVNRHSKRKLVLGDAAAGTLLYSGTLFARDVDEWITGLERIYPEIELVASADGRILIRTRTPGELNSMR